MVVAGQATTIVASSAPSSASTRATTRSAPPAIPSPFPGRTTPARRCGGTTLVTPSVQRTSPVPGGRSWDETSKGHPPGCPRKRVITWRRAPASSGAISGCSCTSVWSTVSCTAPAPPTRYARLSPACATTTASLATATAVSVVAAPRASGRPAARAWTAPSAAAAARRKIPVRAWTAPPTAPAARQDEARAATAAALASSPAASPPTPSATASSRAGPSGTTVQSSSFPGRRTPCAWRPPRSSPFRPARPQPACRRLCSLSPQIVTAPRGWEPSLSGEELRPSALGRLAGQARWADWPVKRVGRLVCQATASSCWRIAWLRRRRSRTLRFMR